MMYQYEPVGVCSMRMNIEVDGEIIKKEKLSRDTYKKLN